MSSEPLTADEIESIRRRCEPGAGWSSETMLRVLDAFAAASEEPRSRSDVDREALRRYFEGKGWSIHRVGAGGSPDPFDDLAAFLAALPSPRSDDRRVDMFATTLQETGRLTVHPGDEQAALAALRALGIDTFEVAAPRSDDREREGK